MELDQIKKEGGHMHSINTLRAKMLGFLRYVFLTAAGFLITHSAYAIDFGDINPKNLNVATFVTNLSKSIPSLMELTTAIAYVLGFYFVITGLLHLKKYGEQRSHSSGEASLKGPLLFLFVGAALIYLPSTVRTGLSTFWTNPMPYAYDTEHEDAWGELVNATFMIIQLVGVIAFIRGLVMLTALGGHHGGQQGGIGKALAHIIGGILCIDMYDFLQTVLNTLALGK
jgi:intracellular multiplication protein IcmC